jgi:hypothetical protein
VAKRLLFVIALLISSTLVLQEARSQNPAREMPAEPVTRGGEVVTPVAGAPFSATVEQRITPRTGLAENNTRGPQARNNIAIIARDSMGHTYNETREIVPATPPDEISHK